MDVELKIPEIGESITEVQIAEWLKAEGDAVEKGAPVVVIDSEKTTLELPAPESGTLEKILRRAGETVAVGEVIGHLKVRASSATPAPHLGDKPPEKSGSSRSKSLKPLSSGIAGKEIERAAAKPAGRPPEPTETTQSQEASVPAAANTEPELVESSSPRGSQEPAVNLTSNDEEEIVPMSMLRRTVARRLVEAKQQMAMLTTFNEVDMSAVQALRHEHEATFEKRHQVKLGLMSFFVKAVIDALKQFPQLNAEVRGHDIAYHNYFNLGVAIATGRGLVVPVLRHAERMSFAEVEMTIGDLARRAKDGKLKPDELEGATFTITNGGVFGSLLSTPIINPPQSGILGMHTIQERPVASQGQVVVRPMMYIALTYDHRIVDGREAVLFTRRVKEVIESPARMLIEV